MDCKEIEKKSDLWKLRRWETQSGALSPIGLCVHLENACMPTSFTYRYFCERQTRYRWNRHPCDVLRQLFRCLPMTEQPRSAKDALELLYMEQFNQVEEDANEKTKLFGDDSNDKTKFSMWTRLSEWLDRMSTCVDLDSDFSWLGRMMSVWWIEPIFQTIP